MWNFRSLDSDRCTMEIDRSDDRLIKYRCEIILDAVSDQESLAILLSAIGGELIDTKVMIEGKVTVGKRYWRYVCFDVENDFPTDKLIADLNRLTPWLDQQYNPPLIQFGITVLRGVFGGLGLNCSIVSCAARINAYVDIAIAYRYPVTQDGNSPLAKDEW